MQMAEREVSSRKSYLNFRAAVEGTGATATMLTGMAMSNMTEPTAKNVGLGIMLTGYLAIVATIARRTQG